jgi:hypothetical protein
MRHAIMRRPRSRKPYLNRILGAIYTAIFGSLFVFSAPVAGAPIQSLVLVSSHNGDFDYGLEVALDHGMVLAPGSTIELTGLAGVSTASVESSLLPCFAVGTVTATSVSWVSTSTCPVFDPVPATLLLEGLHLFSSVTSLAPVAYDIRAGAAGIVSGFVRGPAVVDEPATLWLAALACVTGLAANLGRRRGFACPCGSSLDSRLPRPVGGN